MLDPNAQILIVDDSRVMRLAMQTILAELGYSNTIEAADGEEAVSVHGQARPALIFLDVVMPKLRGDEALAQIRETDTTTPIVMLSSVCAQSEIDACHQLGILDFIVKPFVNEDGIAIVREQLQKIA